MRYFTKLINRLRRFIAEKRPFHTFIASKIDDFPSKQTNTFWMMIITDRGNRLESGKITDGRGCYSKRRRRRRKKCTKNTARVRGQMLSPSLALFPLFRFCSSLSSTRLSFTLGLCHSRIDWEIYDFTFNRFSAQQWLQGARTHFQNRLAEFCALKMQKVFSNQWTRMKLLMRRYHHFFVPFCCCFFRFVFVLTAYKIQNRFFFAHKCVKCEHMSVFSCLFQSMQTQSILYVCVCTMWRSTPIIMFVAMTLVRNSVATKAEAVERGIQ